MKFNDTTNYIKHSFDELCLKFYNRYPNPHSTHVISEDTISRSIDGNNILRTVKLYHKRNGKDLPGWLQMLLPSPTAYLVEESLVDLNKKVITTYTKNISLTTLLDIDEKCIFTKCDSNYEWTAVKRYAWMNSHFYGFASLLEGFGMSRYLSNINRMDAGFDYVLNNGSSALHNTEQVDTIKNNKEIYNIPISNKL